MSKKHFCTCTDTSCPFNPANHDQGCTPCIANNLKSGEIPSCFFKAVSGNDYHGRYYYKDFAKEVLKSSEEHKETI
ncbi:MAG: DUF6485 family protein [Lachnospiraceae bacterium]|jgi:hypothetical protein